MIEPVEFVKYDKISDDVFILGLNTILRFTVSCSKINNDKRYHFYKEFEYPSKVSDKTLITIKRSFDYYLSIENIQKPKTGEDKAFIRIGISEFYKFKAQVDMAVSWFTDKKYKSLYAKNKGQLILTSPVPENILGGYPQNKFLRFVPTIIDKGEGKDRFERGVEIDLSSYDNYVILNLDRLFGLQYIISNFNMYMAAQNLIGYLGIPSGLNRTSFAYSNGNNSKLLEVEDLEEMAHGVDGRTIGKKNISALE